jgi:hypothetical protein
MPPTSTRPSIFDNRRPLHRTTPVNTRSVDHRRNKNASRSRRRGRQREAHPSGAHLHSRRTHVPPLLPPSWGAHDRHVKFCNRTAANDSTHRQATSCDRDFSQEDQTNRRREWKLALPRAVCREGTSKRSDPEMTQAVRKGPPSRMVAIERFSQEDQKDRRRAMGLALSPTVWCCVARPRRGEQSDLLSL